MILSGPSCPELLRDETLADILRLTARQQPDKVALRFGDAEVTYAHLVAAAERLAREMGAHLPKARLSVIENAGHAVHLERPEDVAMLLG
jgi:pimeloyl-ACP methyl ester carboxylesterase